MRTSFNMNIPTERIRVYSSRQPYFNIQQEALNILLGRANKNKRDSLSISAEAKNFSKENIAALIDDCSNTSPSELTFYFAHYNDSKAILDAINFSKNVECGYDPQFKDYGVFSFELNGRTQKIPNYAVPKMNVGRLPEIKANDNALVLKNMSYYSWTASNGHSYSWAVNNGHIGWADSESLLSEATGICGKNYGWEMTINSGILTDLARGNSLYGEDRAVVLETLNKIGIKPGFFSIDAGAGKHRYYLEESGDVQNVDKNTEYLDEMNWLEAGYEEGDTFSVYGKEYSVDSKGHLNIPKDCELKSPKIKYPCRN